MTLLAPVWLLFGALAVAGIVLLQMRRRRQVSVPSVLLWRVLDNLGSPRRAMKWPPPSLLLLLQLLVVALVALALTQPLFGADRGDLEHTVYVVDASASMRATDGDPTRFDSALGALRERIEALPEGGDGRASLILAGPRPSIEIARQSDPAGILPLLDGLAATDAGANWAGTADLIQSLIAVDDASRIVVLSDATDPGVSVLNERLENADIEIVRLGTATTANRALTATLGPSEEDSRTRVLSGVVTFAGRLPTEPVIVDIAFRPEGAESFVEIATLEIEAPEAPERSDIDEDSPDVAPSLLTADFETELDVPGSGALLVTLPDDAGPADNVVRILVRAEPVLARVLYLGRQSRSLVAALQALDTVELFESDTLPGNAADFDLVIVDNVTIAQRPATNVLWIGSGRVAGMAQPALIEQPTVSDWDEAHPLARSVSWAGIAPELGYGIARLSGATVLLGSGDLPLVQARTTADGREVRIAFDIETSDWVDQSGFPVFVANLIGWLEGGFGTETPEPCIAGRSCAIEARLVTGEVVDEAGNSVWRLGAVDGTFLLDGLDRSFFPARAGFYRLIEGEDERLLVVAADTASETDLGPRDDIGTASLSAGWPGLWWWLLAAALVLLLAETWLAGRGPEQFLKSTGLARSNPLAARRRTMLGIRVIAIAFLVAAVVGVPWLSRVPAEDVVVVMSSDLGPEQRNANRERLLTEAAANRSGAGARGTVIGADGGDAGGTDLESAALLAAALVPGDREGRIVLATDGNETEGEIALAVEAFAARGLTVDIQPLSDLPIGEVLVEQITAPPRVFEGDSFYLEAVIFSQQAGTANVTIVRAGEIVLEQEVTLREGRSMVETIVPAGEAGALLVEVSVDAPGDTYAQNNTNGLIVEVESPPSIAIVTPQPPLGEYFAQALTVQGLSAEIILPADAPTTMDGWLAYDAVVLMNVPAIAFDPDNQEYLEELVRVHGRGLLILGGENTFGPGGYFQTPLEDLSPLSSRIPHEAAQVAMVFVLDRSGSMNAPVQDLTRLDIAKQATVTAVSLLNPDAQVGVVVFDSQATVIVPLTENRDVELVAGRLGPLIEGGGTNMFPGLESAINELTRTDAATKHIVVMTDGITNAADFPTLLERAVAEGITISAVGIGAGADDRRLTQIADLGGGTYHSTGDFRALPAILSQEALLLANSPFEEAIAPVAWVDREADFLAGLPDQLPPVYAYVRTSPKPTADLHLTLTDPDGAALPLMASWRYGNGHVLALATHGAGAGTADWIQLPQYPLMWSQTIRHFLPDPLGPGLHLDLVRDGDEMVMSALLLDPDGEPVSGAVVEAVVDQSPGQPIGLKEEAPGRYVASVAVGTGSFSVTATSGELSDEAEIYVAYPARFNFGRADFDKLQALATATGGNLLLGDEPVFTNEEIWVAVPGWRIWAVIAAVLFILDLVVRHAPSLVGLRRRAPRGAPALAMST